MNKIESIKFTKRTDGEYRFDGWCQLEGDATNYFLYDDFIIIGQRKMRLSEISYENRYCDFSDNIDSPESIVAKTTLIFRQDNPISSIGKVSICDGNFPPPYTEIKLRSAQTYDQNALSDDFIVTEMEFILEQPDRYTMKITLQKGSGGNPINIPNRADIREIHNSNNYGLLIGIEDGFGPNVTLEFTATNLDLGLAIGLVLVRYIDGNYNLDITNDHLFKKGVIELH